MNRIIIMLTQLGWDLDNLFAIGDHVYESVPNSLGLVRYVGCIE